MLNRDRFSSGNSINDEYIAIKYPQFGLTKNLTGNDNDNNRLHFSNNNFRYRCRETFQGKAQKVSHY